jgi:transcription elongation factor Elf1
MRSTFRYPLEIESNVKPKPPTPSVTACPFCQSERVSTTSKTLTSSTYWRCHSCGEIWNPGRAAAAPPFRRSAW